MTLPKASIDTARLGQPVARYPAPREDFYKSLLIMVFLLGGALAFILVISVLIALTERVLEVLVIGLVVFGLLAVPVWRLTKFALRLFSVRTIYLYTHGFVLEEGDLSEALHWDDIALLYIKVQRLGVDYLPDTEAVRESARLNFLLTIQRQDGSSFDIESAVRQMKEIANGIGKRLAVHQLPAVQRHIEEQGRYNFGPLTVLADRMRYDDIDYRWHPLKKVWFGYADNMVVLQEGAPRPRAVLPVAGIPNVHLLMLLLAPHADVVDLDGRPVDLQRWQQLLSP